MTASISIIIPVLNEAAIIEKQLIRLRSIVTRECELIVVDGGSEDNSIELAKPFADQVLVANTSGRAFQMNEGGKLANGRLLLFVHIDTDLPDNFIQEILSIKQQQWGFFRVKLSSDLWGFRVIEYMMNLRSKMTRVATGDQCLFMLSSTFNEIKGFAPIPLMEDVELSKRLRKLSPPFIIKSPVVTASRRWEQHGILNTILLMWRLRWDYFCGVDPHKLVNKYYPSNK